MKQKVRNYLIKNTPKTLTTIEDGEYGELSKITEEYYELVDAIEQKNKVLTFIEACDLADAALKYQFKQFNVPSLATLLVIYLRRLYKPFRNATYRYAGLSKDYFNIKE
jgi:plasmid replication initiation protein